MTKVQGLALKEVAQKVRTPPKEKSFKSENRDVFINCPFDNDYQPFFRAAVYVVIRCGFRVRCALETEDSGKSRFLKICDMIDQSAFGFHDISRVELDAVNSLPRFNMPLELGVFLGAARKNQKSCIIFDDVKFRYQKFISDISGQDIFYHEGNTQTLVIEFVNWLRHKLPRGVHVPGGRHVASEFVLFQRKFPNICKERQMQDADTKFKDLEDIIIKYIAGTQAKKTKSTKAKQPVKKQVVMRKSKKPSPAR